MNFLKSWIVDISFHKIYWSPLFIAIFLGIVGIIVSASRMDGVGVLASIIFIFIVPIGGASIHAFNLWKISKLK